MKNKKVEELKRKIKDLEETLFYIEMIDHWTREDNETYEKYSKQIKELKALLVQEIVED
jgi:hypothetical protein